ncbi:hypothetical protein, partial [uncultured Bacteroides sp.]|uniref:hypothetical protein n=1 Tax=uncultured Bacteroides sp. TaxID=162156 RepID=UPI0025989012
KKLKKLFEENLNRLCILQSFLVVYGEICYIKVLLLYDVIRYDDFAVFSGSFPDFYSLLSLYLLPLSEKIIRSA